MFSYKRCVSVAVISALLLSGNIVFAADTSAIENLMNKAAGAKKAPTASEIGVMEGFINEAVNEVLTSTVISEAIDARNQVMKYKGDTEDLSLYTRSYILSAKKSLVAAFDTVGKWPQQAGKLQTLRNLMILTAQLSSLELRDLGISMIDHPDPIIRYWSVKSIAGDAIASQLNSPLTGDAEIKAEIVKNLEARMTKETHPEIIGQIARFSGLLKDSSGIGILNKAADIRIAAYNNWTVKYELIDADILNSMAMVISSTPAGNERQQVAGKFAQLYSCMIQRCIASAGKAKPEALETNISAIASVEKIAITDLLGGRPVTAMITALKKNDMVDLQREHDALLGTGTSKGVLQNKLNFNAIPQKLKVPPAPAGGGQE